MAELSHSAEWELERIEKATVELRKEIIRLETAMDDATGVVQALKDYPLNAAVVRTNLHGHHTPEQARQAAERAHVASLPVVEENKAIIESNRRLLARLLQLITNAGLPEKVSVKRARSRYKWDSVETEWAQAIRTHIPTNDTWPSLKSSYDSWLRQCDEWRRKLDAEVASKKQAEETHKKEIDQEIVRREMVAKYGIAEQTPIGDIQYLLLKKHKYLYLAHFLEANRGDWNEGCDYAETGLSGFTVETDRDRGVEKEIASMCGEGWDGDGRCFRDCQWNYSVLFSIVAEEAPDLLADYQKVSEFISKY